jgi:hypothetical protein
MKRMAISGKYLTRTGKLPGLKKWVIQLELSGGEANFFYILASEVR